MPKRVGDKLWVHRTALGDLNRFERKRVTDTQAMAQVPKGWSVVRLSPGSMMFGWTTDFDADPHPSLLRSFTVTLNSRGKVTGSREVRYNADNPPIYHRKEQMLLTSHPDREKFSRLTRAEEKAGLLGRPDIGRKARWNDLLTKEGFTMRGHRLDKRQGSRGLLSGLLDAAEGKATKKRPAGRQSALSSLLDAAEGKPARQADRPQRGRRRRGRQGRVAIPWLSEDVVGPKGERIGRMDAAKADRVGSRHSRPRNNPDLAPDFEPFLDFDDYDLIAVQYSGGKDSTACLLMVLRLLADRPDLRERVEIWHQDVDGNSDPFMDWPVTLPYTEAVAELFGLPLVVNYREGGFKGEILRRPGQARGRKMLLDRQGKATAIGKKPLPGQLGRRRFPAKSPSLITRWCTGDLKIDVAKTMYGHQATKGRSKILTVTGERVQESAARAGYYRGQPLSETRNRSIHQLRIVYDHDEAAVWDEYRYAFPGEPYGLQPHPVYELGWNRCSCAGCVFSGPKDWAMLRQVAPTFYANVADLERDLGAEALAAHPQAPARIERLQRQHDSVRAQIARINDDNKAARLRWTTTDGRARSALKRRRKREYETLRDENKAKLPALRRKRDDLKERLGKAKGVIGRNIDAEGSIPQVVQRWMQKRGDDAEDLIDPKLKALWGPYLVGEKPWTTKNMLRGSGAPVFRQPWAVPAGAFGESGGPC